MATHARYVMERALKNHTLNATMSKLNMTMAKSNADATGLLIKKLAFAESKSIRTSTIILGAFNILAAFTIACSILHDCYMASKRCNPKFRKFCMKTLHPAETFPLILAIGIFFQGLVFVGVQGTGLASLLTDGCSTIAQFLWPALFIVPYIQLVFGLECAIRSLRSTPFQPRGKYDVAICCGVILLLLVGTWVPSHIFKENNTCFASLMWYITRYGILGLVLLSSIAFLMLVSSMTIFFQLSRFTMVDEHERIAASRMVYYLILGSISLGFVIPWFVSLVTSNGDLKAAMMATVVVNLSGLISGFLQLFLRANTATTSFGPTGPRGFKKHEIRIWGPNELVFNNPLIPPGSGRQAPGDSYLRSGSQAGLVELDGKKGRVISMESLPPTSPGYDSKEFEYTESMPASTPFRSHTKNPSYSLFPVDASNVENKPGVPSNRKQEPTSVYDITDLSPLPAIFTRGHKRDSSIVSTATVQIGLRLSNFVSPQPQLVPLSLPSTTYKANSPSPLKLRTRNDSPPLNSPLRDAATTLSPKVFSPPLMNKTLPPTPEPQHSAMGQESLQLSPSVYSPEKNLSAPKIVEKTAPLSKGPLRGNLLTLSRSPKANQQQSGNSGKPDWI